MEVRCERFLACLGANERAYQNANPNIHGSRVLLRLNEPRATLQMAGRSMNTTELTDLPLLISQAKASQFVLEYLSQFDAEDIDSDSVDLRFEVDDVDTGSTVSIVDECGHAAESIKALVEALDRAQIDHELTRGNCS